MAESWSVLYTASLMILGALILICAIRAVLGPRTADRLMAVNMITTLVTVCICILTLLLGEDYLADIAILFSLTGLLAVAVLFRVLPSRKNGKDVHPGKEAPDA